MHKSCKPAAPTQSSFKSPVTKQFKSPLNRSSDTPSTCTESQLQEQIETLRKTLAKTESEIEQLTALGYKEKELQEHIDKLHEYNEIKDVGQMLMGRIAEAEGLQTKDLYERYELNFND
ncbi:DNA repair protein SWI5 [Biomphalaria glabrata]|nr:DNA repair protein SWI5 [Biomphalaria glabrata]